MKTRKFILHTYFDEEVDEVDKFDQIENVYEVDLVENQNVRLMLHFSRRQKTSYYTLFTNTDNIILHTLHKDNQMHVI